MNSHGKDDMNAGTLTVKLSDLHHDGRGEWSVEVSDLRLNGFPSSIGIETKAADLISGTRTTTVLFTATRVARDADGDVTHVEYQAPRYGRLTIWND